MGKLMYNIVCSDISFIELKLKRIRLYKKRLLKLKPCRLNGDRFNSWQDKLKELEKEEDSVIAELQAAYIDLEKFL